MIRKWTKDGFRNPKYDVWDVKLGITMLFLVVVASVMLIVAG
ncbi:MULTISPECIES: hypothetical protein [unclassified Bacteroides]|jgi:hypothetical protein|nr:MULTISPECIES: hypothetical protein [unclassified Bacteroides]